MVSKRKKKTNGGETRRYTLGREQKKKAGKKMGSLPDPRSGRTGERVGRTRMEASATG